MNKNILFVILFLSITFAQAQNSVISKGWLGDKLEKRQIDSLNKIWEEFKPKIEAYNNRLKEFEKINFAKIEFVRIKPEYKKLKVYDTLTNKNKKVIISIQSSAIKNGEFDSSRIETRYFLEKDDYNNLFWKLFNDDITRDFSSKKNEPKQGIVYYDENEKYYGFIEFDFQSLTMNVTEKIPHISNMKTTQYSDLFWLMYIYDIVEESEFINQ